MPCMVLPSQKSLASMIQLLLKVICMAESRIHYRRVRTEREIRRACLEVKTVVQLVGTRHAGSSGGSFA